MLAAASLPHLHQKDLSAHPDKSFLYQIRLLALIVMGASAVVAILTRWGRYDILFA